MIKLFFPFFILISLVSSVNSASAGVMVFDDAVPVQKPFRIQALTKGLFFPEGGRLVTFHVGAKKIGTTLSGGDGYAFISYTPPAPGILDVMASSGDETSSGTILVTEKNDKIIVLEIESSLFENILTTKPRENSKPSLEKLSQRFRIIYLSSLIGTEQSKKWLRKHGFPPSPVFTWGGPARFDELTERGVHLYAIIASPDILRESSEIQRRFSLRETEDGTEAGDWDDLMDHLSQTGDN